MWEAQDYNPDSRHLLIWDDQPNFEDCSGSNWTLKSFEHNSLGHISQKYWRMVNCVLNNYGPDYIVIWEDDDIYLPQHISQSIACAEVTGCPVVRNRTVWTNHPGGAGKARLYNTGAAYHGTWVFTPEAYRVCGGYRNMDVREFDTDFCGRLSNYSEVASSTNDNGPHPAVSGYWGARFPTYVYRFGTTGYPNASAYGPNFSDAYDSLHSDEVIYDRPVPAFDPETELLMDLPSGKLPESIRDCPEDVTDGLKI